MRKPYIGTFAELQVSEGDITISLTVAIGKGGEVIFSEVVCHGSSKEAVKQLLTKFHSERGSKWKDNVKFPSYVNFSDQSDTPRPRPLTLDDPMFG